MNSSMRRLSTLQVNAYSSVVSMSRPRLCFVSDEMSRISVIVPKKSISGR